MYLFHTAYNTDYTFLRTKYLPQILQKRLKISFCSEFYAIVDRLLNGKFALVRCL